MRYLSSIMVRLWPAVTLLFVLICCVAGALQAQAPVEVSTSISLDQRGNPVATTVGTGPSHHPSRVLVRFRDGGPADFLPGSGPARPLPGGQSLYVVPNPPGLAVAAAMRRYHANPNVLYAEPDYVVQITDTTPSDPLWSQQWDMVKISAPAAWASHTNSGDVVVAIIDSGIDFTHPDLRGNLWVNPQNGGNGFTCMNGKCTSGGADDYGHGTHVAGAIGAVANDGIGVAGINWRVQLLSLKFLDSSGSGYISDAVLCYNQVALLKQQGVNIRVVNNSWGGGGFSQALKDAMAQVEAAGVVNVCAAGNSSQNADLSPMYPAAYDNHGIVSVLASDQQDAGASFTNYGLSSVDIAAPGVSTISTVPSSACTLCDPTGYKVLSGTSMAAPHVSGVLAAMFHENPNRTAYEVRDVALAPGSYDSLADQIARTTSTGGRLNFARALANPLLLSPTFALNHFPTLVVGPDIFASAGGRVKLSATASDADNDPLVIAWTRALDTSRLWLFGFMLNTVFPNPTGTSAPSFSAPTLGRTAVVPYSVSVADGRGGSAQGRENVTVAGAANPGLPPSGNLTVSPASGPVGTKVTVKFPAKDREKGQVAWDLWSSTKYGASGQCCYTGSSATLTLNSAGVYRIGVQAIDSMLNLSARQTAVVSIGGATGVPPIAKATLDKLSGPAPLTVNIDMSGSYDPDGTIQRYYFDCGAEGVTAAVTGAQGSCTFNTPGIYWILLQVQDNGGSLDTVSAYVVVTPVQN